MEYDYTPRNSKIQKSSSKIAFSSSRLIWNKSKLVDCEKFSIKIDRLNTGLQSQIEIEKATSTKRYAKRTQLTGLINRTAKKIFKLGCLQLIWIICLTLITIVGDSSTLSQTMNIFESSYVKMSGPVISVIQNQMTVLQRYQNKLDINKPFFIQFTLNRFFSTYALRNFSRWERLYQAVRNPHQQSWPRDLAETIVQIVFCNNINNQTSKSLVCLDVTKTDVIEPKLVLKFYYG